MKRIDATRETILNVNDFVDVISENGQHGLVGKTKLLIDGESIEVYGLMSNEADAVEACILFEGGEGDLTREALFPQLCHSFGIDDGAGWKYWQICGVFDETTTVGKVIDTYNEYPSGYWATGAFSLATPAGLRAIEEHRAELARRAEEERRALGFAYSENYSTDSWYTGRHDHHHSHRSGFVMNKPTLSSKYPFKVGIELEVIANDEASDRKITELKSNWFYMENDGSLETNGIEIITVPLRFEDAMSADFWRPFTEWLSRYAKSWSKSCCGLHVHIGNEVFSTDGMDSDMLKAKLAYAYNYCIDNDEINKKVFGRATGYSSSKCKTKTGDAVETLGDLTDGKSTLLKMKKVQDAIVDETKRRMRDDRYFEINYSNAKTTEFRKGRGSINCERISSVVMYCYLMTQWTKKEKWENLLNIAEFKAFLDKNAKDAHPLRRFLSSDESDC